MFQAVSRGIPSFGDQAWKQPCRMGTTAALPANTRTGDVLTASANGALGSIDGVAAIVGDRVLVRSEATGVNNGIYAVTSLGSAGSPWVLTRATDADSAAEGVQGATTWVHFGTLLGGTSWVASGVWVPNVVAPAWASDAMQTRTGGSSQSTAVDSGGTAAMLVRSDSGAAAQLQLNRRTEGFTRVTLDDTGTLRAGSGAAGFDVRLQRSAAKTWAFDDAAGGALTLVDLLTAPIQGKVPLVTVFPANGTWTPGANWQYALAEVVGGGGQGGGSVATGAGQASHGGAGGAGGTARKLIRRSDMTGNGTITVGSGGSTGGAGANGQAGALSSFAATGLTTVQGNGGAGGTAGTAAINQAASGGAGGTATGGDINLTGGDGSNGVSISGLVIPAGQGGASALGLAVKQSNVLAGSSVGTAGHSYGGGGTGGSAGASLAAQTGGAGAGGVVIVTEFYGP